MDLRYKKTFAVLDTRCGEISAVAARWLANGEYKIEGFEICPSEGIHRGMVTDMEKAIDSVSEAMRRLREKTLARIRDVYVTISSSSVEIIPSSGTCLLSRYGREVQKNDMERCIELGSIAKISPGKETLHRFIKGYSIDGEGGILNPVGLEGVKLGIEIDVVAIDSAVLRNLLRCVSMAGYYIAGCVLSGVAYSFRSLTDSERRDGVALLCICRDMTEMTVFGGSLLRKYRTFRNGSQDLLAAGEGAADFISVVNGMAARGQIKTVVVTGDAVMADDIISPLEASFSVPVRFGSCITKHLEDLPPERLALAGSLGILDYLQQNTSMWSSGGNLLTRGMNRVIGFMDRYF